MSQKTISVLVSDKLAKEGVAVLEATPGVKVTVRTGLTPEELKQELPKHDAIIIRSATKLTADVLAAAPRLKAIARAGVGVDNVDVAAASKNGTIVMNTPDGNTVSTAELAVTLLLALCRHIAPACAKLKAGEWDKKSFEGIEVRGKTIGIVGLGRIGCEVAKRCLGLQLRVLGYDPFLSQERAKALGITLCPTVAELVPEVDFLTVHTPLTDETRGIIGRAEFASMKRGVLVVNDARGGIIDEEALLEALESGQCGGAALDVFTVEPPKDRRLVDHPKVLCTPHLGASTEEAQVQVAIDAARQIADALLRGEVRSALNYPALAAEDATELAPYGRLALKLGRFAGQVVEGQIRSVEVVYAGEIADKDLRGVTMNFTLGLMSCFEEGANLVSAPLLARDRGVEIRATTTETAQDFQSLIEVTVEASGGRRTCAGTIFGRNIPRLVMVDGYHVEAEPEGALLLFTNADKPGIIGAIGTALGKAGINIATCTWGRHKEERTALSVVAVDADAVAPAVLEDFRRIPDVTSVRLVRL